MASLALGLGLASVAGGVASSVIGANAAQTAASEQEQAAQNALNFQQQVFGQQQANEQPFLNAGSASVGQLMQAIQNGTFGPGSIPSFALPTLAQAEQYPGYQFTQEQGDLGIERGQAAAGGAFTGGTLKALAGYNSGLASTTYGQVVQNALQAYQANLANQAQQYQQLFGPAQLGQQAVSSINQTGTQTAANAGNLMTQIGNAQAAGTVGTANAITGGISSATNGLLQGLLLNQFLPGSGGAGATGINNSSYVPFQQSPASAGIASIPGNAVSNPYIPPISLGGAPG